MNTIFYDVGNQFRNDDQNVDIKFEKWHHMKTTSSWNMKEYRMRMPTLRKRHEKELTTSDWTKERWRIKWRHNTGKQ